MYLPNEYRLLDCLSYMLLKDTCMQRCLCDCISFIMCMKTSLTISYVSIFNLKYHLSFDEISIQKNLELEKLTVIIYGLNMCLYL